MKRKLKKIKKLDRKRCKLIDKIGALEQKRIEVTAKMWLLQDEVENGKDD